MGEVRDAGREPRSDAVRVVGIDLYNQAMTGGVSKTLNNRATDADHVPCVLIRGGLPYIRMEAEKCR